MKKQIINGDGCEKDTTLNDQMKDILSDRTGQKWSGLYFQKEDVKESVKVIKNAILNVRDLNAAFVIKVIDGIIGEIK